MATTVLYFPNENSLPIKNWAYFRFPYSILVNFLQEMSRIRSQVRKICNHHIDVAVNVFLFNSNYLIAPVQFIVHTNEPV